MDQSADRPGTEPRPDGPLGLFSHNPCQDPIRALLGRAKHLGYLEADEPTGPVIDRYQSWCYRRGVPMVLLYSKGGRSSAVVYRLPDMDKALTPCAVALIRRRARVALLPGSPRRQVICRCGGEILGLDPSKAEAVAFWIADAASDPDQTGPLSRVAAQ